MPCINIEIWQCLIAIMGNHVLVISKIRLHWVAYLKKRTSQRISMAQ